MITTYILRQGYSFSELIKKNIKKVQADMALGKSSSFS